MIACLITFFGGRKKRTLKQGHEDDKEVAWTSFSFQPVSKISGPVEQSPMAENCCAE